MKEPGYIRTETGERSNSSDVDVPNVDQSDSGIVRRNIQPSFDIARSVSGIHRGKFASS